MNQRFRSIDFVLILLSSVFIVCGLAAQTESGSGKGKERRVIIGFLSSMLSDVDKKDAKVAMKAWADHQSQEDGQNFVTESEIYESLDELVSALKAKAVDMAAISGLDYLLIKDEVPLVPRQVSAWSDSPYGVELLLIHRDSGISSVEELKGKALNIERLGSGKIPQIFIDNQLAQKGLPGHKQFFGMVKLLDKASTVVMPVFFRQTDACLVREQGFQLMVELNPQLGNSLKIIARSQPFLRALVCYRKDYDQDNQDRLVRSSMKLHKTVKGRQILTLFKVEKLIEFDPLMLQGNEKLLSDYLAFKGGKKP